MTTLIKDAGPPGRDSASAALARHLPRALAVLAGLATVVLAFAWFLSAYRSVDAYRAAPVCGTAAAAPGAPCVRHETGKVTARAVDNGGDSTTYSLTVSREEAPTLSYSVGQAFHDDAEVGVDVDLTIWNGRVAELSWHGHRASPPDIPWSDCFRLALLVGAGSALTVCGLARPRGGAWAVPPLAGIFIAFLSFIGSFILCLAQWPLVVTLGGPVLGWLILTAIATAIAADV
ncbi:hypothetical protein ACFQ6N_34670 [Kitasatospora sp. NPDC056446]|uniref:hypothetical protein n=1 Tax=Kitasatospora sp. NPDC056446 TaxID=3345819 RepID=UPI0036B892FC